MFGLSKKFVICLIIAILVSFGMRNAWFGVQIMIAYIIIISIWNILTIKRR